VRREHVGLGERVTVPLEQLALCAVPHGLGVQEQAVHVEHDRPEAAGKAEHGRVGRHGDQVGLVWGRQDCRSNAGQPRKSIVAERNRNRVSGVSTT
jgi:hypothetical protein